jgi:hypothetical protein
LSFIESTRSGRAKKEEEESDADNSIKMANEQRWEGERKKKEIDSAKLNSSQSALHHHRCVVALSLL